MKDIEQKKEFQSQLENAAAGLYFGFLKNKRDSFEFSDVAQILAKDKNDEDLLFVCDAFTKWHNNSKKEAQKKELLSLLQGVWRVSSYCINLETITKQSVSKYVDIEKRNMQLVSEKRTIELKNLQQIEKLENEIKSLKAELEFVSSGNR